MMGLLGAEVSSLFIRRPPWRTAIRILLMVGFGCQGLSFAVHAEELAINRRTGANKQATFVSAEYPHPFGPVVLRMAESEGKLSALHFISQQGVVMVPPHLIEGMAASSQAELSWYLEADGGVRAKVLLPCKGYTDQPLSGVPCKRAYIFFEGALRRVIVHTPRDGGSTVRYIDLND